nr:MarR family transcriptional regulator [Methanohalophilus levihalophilus]
MSQNTDLDAYSEVSFASFSYLLELRSLGTSTLSELAASMGVTKPSASNMVRKLVSMGYVDEKRSDEDKRVCRLSLSGEGIRIIELGLSADQMFFGRIQEILDENEFATFKQLWLKISSSINEEPTK